MSGLNQIYTLRSLEDATAFYDGWADGYDAELEDNGYATPARCAAALAEFATAPEAPVADFGCGTGLSGLALRRHGFNHVYGYDISQEMLVQARAKDCYREAAVLDMSQPFEGLPKGHFQNAAAIGSLSPWFMPPTVLDEMLGLLPAGGCLVCSLNDHALKEGSMETRILELTEHAAADLVFKDHGDHLPGQDLLSTVYVLKKR
ncbi:MAG: methyltransferase domain-containing protein [Pseudomonadota bacterium]